MGFRQITLPSIFAPYSQSFGEPVKIPMSPYSVHVFPGKLFIEGVLDHSLDIEGPIKDFFVQSDFVGDLVYIRVTDRFGSIWLELSHVEKKLILTTKRSNHPRFIKGDVISFAVEKPPYERVKNSTLFFGDHSAQEIRASKKRPTCFFSLWHQAGLFACDGTLGKGGNFSLLQECKQAILAKDEKGSQESFLNLLQSAISGIFVPVISDIHHLHIAPSISLEGNPDFLLSEVSACLESLLVDVKGHRLDLFPFLIKLFSSGKAKDISTSLCRLDLHWKNSKPFSAIIRHSSVLPWQIFFPSPYTRARLQWSGGHKTIKNGEDLVLDPQSVYYVDRFEK